MAELAAQVVSIAAGSPHVHKLYALQLSRQYCRQQAAYLHDFHDPRCLCDAVKVDKSKATRLSGGLVEHHAYIAHWAKDRHGQVQHLVPAAFRGSPAGLQQLEALHAANGQALRNAEAGLKDGQLQTTGC